MIGQTISHYKITEKLGEGGMGVVYKAQDTSLDRTVALKFLAGHLLESEEHKQRFLREAKAAASLDHPNICTIHEVGEADGQVFLAMGYIDGPEIRAKIKERPLKLDEALDIARQAAEGLRAAHQKGIVHRDIKSSNLMLTYAGQVKIMDFGLAQLTSGTRLTKTDTILGTPAYMSPEQAQGLPTDRRTDIWSLGVVLYEMVTGRLPFEGEREQAVVYSIIHESHEPITAIRAGVPLEFDRIVGKALAKKKEERYQHLDDMLVDLRALGKNLFAPVRVIGAVPDPGKDSPGEGSHTGSSASVPMSRTPQQQADGRAASSARRPFLLIGLGVTLLAAVAIVALWLRLPEPQQHRDVVRFHLTPGINICTPVISPNGRHVAYDACEQQGKLWIWDLERGTAREIEGTEGASQPFWSPASDFIGFLAGGVLKKVSVDGGLPSTLCPVPREFGGGTWSPDGKTVVFAELFNGGLYEVSSSGGKPNRLIEPGDPLSQSWLGRPHFLPLEDGRRILLFSSGELILQDLESGKRKILGDGDIPLYSPSGHILYWSNDSPSDLWALPFSIEELKATGKPFLVAEDIGIGSIAANGTLVYLDPEVKGPWRLLWLDRSGNRQDLIGQPQKEIYDPVLSPDGRTVVVTAQENDHRDIWVHDANRAVKSPLTADSVFDTAPVWSPSGNRVVFSSVGRGMFVKAMDLSSEATVLWEDGLPLSWSEEEKYLLYACGNAATGGDLCYLDRRDNRYERLPYVETPFEERAGALSPDGRSVAYASNETGRFEVFVQRFPDRGDKRQVSDNGGGQPVWSKNGKQLFFVEGETLVVVSLTTTPSFPAGQPTKLFRSARFRGMFMGTDAYRAQYDVSADGQRIVLAEPTEAEKSIPSSDDQVTGRTIRVVQNWYEEFRDRQQD